jgi:ferredoxin
VIDAQCLWKKLILTGEFTIYKVDIEKCSACETCIDICPSEAISIVDGHAFIDADECIECGSCADECPEEAIVEED